MIIILERFASRRARRLAANVVAALTLGWVAGVVTCGYVAILLGHGR